MAIIAAAPNDQVLILSGGAPSSNNTAGGNDVNFYVSGSIGSKGSGSVRGTSYFEGDIAILGNTHGLGGRYIASPSPKTGTYNVLIDDYFIPVNVTGGTAQINLPASATSNGRLLIIADTNANSNNNAITLNPNASETINGAASFDIDVAGKVVTILNDGAGWIVISTNQ
jgi:hypothetical protein